MIPEAAVEAAVNARGRANNPKWDHPIFGYQTFSEDQKEHLREEARTQIEAAAPFMRPDFRESNLKAIGDELAKPIYPLGKIEDKRR